MSKVELESFLKSFSLFFSTIMILVSTIYYINYTKDIQKLESDIFSQMRICSFDLECPKYEIDFVPIEEKERYKLYKNSTKLAAYFPIIGSTQNSLEISYGIKFYELDKEHIRRSTIVGLVIVMAAVLLLSILFSLYTLYPLRNALRITEEFVKDILHDFNTPLATLRLNAAMLNREFGESNKIARIQKSVQTILNLQTNLRAYLDHDSLNKEILELGEFLEQRVEHMRMSYPNIEFVNRVENISIYTNIDAFTRIIDNILSNAAKYNKEDGKVELFMEKNSQILSIKDTGKGIQNTNKIFNRFYKEQERGIGIGLHIVKKLCDELGIKIEVESQLDKGTSFHLKFTS